jgi:hypothetical protein
MELLKKEVSVPKEVSEVFDALALLVAEIKAKKEVAVIVAESLPAIIKAVDGFQNLGEEVKSAEFYDAAALGLGQLLKAILK